MSSSDEPDQAVTESVETESVETVVTESEVTETEEIATDPTVPAGATAAGPWRRALTWCRGRPVPVLAMALLLVSAVAAGSVYWWVYRPDRMTDAAAQQQAVAAAREGTEALLSYSPEKLDADLANARSHLTDPFLSYYSDFTDTVVAPAARDKGVKTEANVARAAVSAIRPGRAEVLVFVNPVTTSRDRPTPALATSSVMVTLVQTGGRWLISEFAPI